METVSLLVGFAALLLALVTFAMQLVGRDVVATLHFTRAQEIPALKRQLASCLFVLVALTTAFAASCVLAVAWVVSANEGEIPPNTPWWVTGWIVLGFLNLCAVGRFIWLCFRFALLLRDPNTLTFTETWLLLWALIRGQDHVVIYSHREESLD